MKVDTTILKNKGKVNQNFYLEVSHHLSGGISDIGSTLDSTLPQAGLRKTLERQPPIDPNC
jgi:hypothetical protein